MFDEIEQVKQRLKKVYTSPEMLFLNRHQCANYQTEDLERKWDQLNAIPDVEKLKLLEEIKQAMGSEIPLDMDSKTGRFVKPELPPLPEEFLKTLREKDELLGSDPKQVHL